MGNRFIGRRGRHWSRLIQRLSNLSRTPSVNHGLSTCSPSVGLFLSFSFSPVFCSTFSPLARFLPPWFPGLSFPEVGRKGKEMLVQIRYNAFGMVKEDMVEHYRLGACAILSDCSTYRVVERLTFQLFPNISMTPSSLLIIFEMPWR